MEQIRSLRLEVEQARAILTESQPTDLIDVSEELEKELQSKPV